MALPRSMKHCATWCGRGTLQHAAILAIFCWGDPENPEELAPCPSVPACYDVAKGFGVPFISGKDSLNNTWRDTAAKSIPFAQFTYLAIGVIEDVSRVISTTSSRRGLALPDR